MSKCCGPLRGVVPPLWAGISMSAPAAGIAPSPYNCCRNRHCPKCQIAARDRWIAARQRELLPTPYVARGLHTPSQVGATGPAEQEDSSTISCSAPVRKLFWKWPAIPLHLGAEIGFFSVLHTWNQKIELHPHLHCVVPAGGLSPDHTRWVRSRDNYFLPKKVLRKIFRGKFVDALKQAFQNGQLNFHGDLQLLAQPKIFAAWLRPLFHQRLGGVLANAPSVAPHMCCNIWAATPIAWPSPIIA